eukprot:365942-Chlamydomonas_euryale.AAC.38
MRITQHVRMYLRSFRNHFCCCVGVVLLVVVIAADLTHTSKVAWHISWSPFSLPIFRFPFCLACLPLLVPPSAMCALFPSLSLSFFWLYWQSLRWGMIGLTPSDPVGGGQGLTVHACQNHTQKIQSIPNSGMPV